MCGIVGFVGNGGDEKLLKRMTDRIRHRGPDDDGFLINEKTGAFLGMRRLSIIDVAGGKQPIFNEEGSVGVVYNGEIYNYKELRLELERAGHMFKTHSDTESIVHGYEEWGTDVFTKLNGMFAIALWDAQKNRLVLGRDRVGEKPLMYAEWSGTFYFGSELKAFFEIPGFPRDIDSGSFVKFIDQGYVWGTNTILKEVKRLGAGEWLAFENGKLKIGKYWEVSILSSRAEQGEVEGSHNARDIHQNEIFSLATLGRNDNARFDQALQQLDSLLSDAVKIRLMSEVPLGVFLSGGLDSSLIAYYAQKNSSQNIKTFSVKFEDESFDETRYARRVAGFLGTEHTELAVGDNELLSIIDNLPSIMDEPLADSSIVPTYWLSKLTREHVTVALGGDAGDELFWGYQTFHAWKYWNLLRYIPAPIRSFVSTVIGWLPSSGNYFSLDFKLKRGLLNFNPDPVNQHFRWLSPFSIGELRMLFRGVVDIESLYAYPNKNCYSNSCSGNDPLVQSANLYQKYYLTDDIFTKIDRASMANSLETRAPFVDYRLIEFANRLPEEFKFHNGESKYILKKLAEQVLPKEIVNREKHGFPSPVDRWLRGSLRKKVTESLSREVIEKQGLLNSEYVQFLWNDFLKGNHYRARQIWTLFVWQLWSKRYLR